MRLVKAGPVVLIALLIGLSPHQLEAQPTPVPVTGHVYDSTTNLAICGVNVIVMSSSRGVSTDSLGNFVLDLLPGEYRLTVSFVGYKSKILDLNITRPARYHRLDIGLAPAAFVTDEVVVSADRFHTSPAVTTMKAKDLEYVPNLFSDVLRSVTILPGVSSNNELTSTYNVHGQNFNDNLIYLDGFEIYRPYLAQRGIQESQSVINQNMVSGFKFYNAAFPVEYGDKMSSVLSVTYRDREDTVLGGEVNADLLNAGVTLHDRMGGLSWIAGFRYAYPGAFTKVLQTKGNYLPRYSDFQLFGSYLFPGGITAQLLFITAKNSFDLTPQAWVGNFQYNNWFNFQRIYLEFQGGENYKYDSNLLGVRFITPFSTNTTLSTSLALYSDKESYNENLNSNAYYAPDAYNPLDTTYLQSGNTFAANSLLMKRVEMKADFSSGSNTLRTIAGITLRSSLMNNVLDESTAYTSVSGPPAVSYSNQRFVFNSLSAYLGEDIQLRRNLSASLGLRALKDYFNGELLFSPRASASFQPNAVSSVNLGWGYYYQPPSFYETRDKSAQAAKSLLAQRAIHYVLSYDRDFGHGTSLTAEIFYQDLSRLIPFSFTNQLELTYGDSNNYNGYAYGLDLQYRGKLSQHLDTWIGYDYLVARERNDAAGAAYQNSLLDQTHTIRIYLQDAMPQIHNSQAHVRLLFGTGYQYHPLFNAPGTSPTSNPQMVPDYNVTETYPWYYRVDMGLTLRLGLIDKATTTLTIDVFNVFDNRNIDSYSWYVIPQLSPQPVPIPNVLSTRYFDVGARIDF